jgi:hypothetical protein
MSDLVIRIEPNAGADVAGMIAAMTERLDGVSGVDEVDVATTAEQGERIDLQTVEAGLGAVTVMLTTARLSVTGARKFLEEIRDTLKALTGVKQAALELVGRPSLPIVGDQAPAAIREADAEAVAEETSGL